MVDVETFVYKVFCPPADSWNIEHLELTLSDISFYSIDEKKQSMLYVVHWVAQYIAFKYELHNILMYPEWLWTIINRNIYFSLYKMYYLQNMLI